MDVSAANHPEATSSQTRRGRAAGKIVIFGSLRILLRQRSLPAPKCFLSQLGEFSVFLGRRLLAEPRFLAPQGEHRTYSLNARAALPPRMASRSDCESSAKPWMNSVGRASRIGEG